MDRAGDGYISVRTGVPGDGDAIVSIGHKRKLRLGHTGQRQPKQRQHEGRSDVSFHSFYPVIGNLLKQGRRNKEAGTEYGTSPLPMKTANSKHAFA